MANLLFKNYNTGCYISWGTESAVPGDYCYGYASNLASYYADLKPNTTYTIQRIDNSTRFRLGLTATDIKYLTATSGTTRSGIWAWGYRYDSSYPITFTTTDTATHLCVYYTNNSEYTTRVMLNEGSTIQPYEAPTETFGWKVLNGQLTNSGFIEMPSTPFVGDSPLSMWRITDTINNNMPYVPLMIDLPALELYIQPSRPLIHAYSSRETDFNGNGYAIIEPISCEIHHEENGIYEATFEAYCDKWDKFTYLKKQALVKIPLRYHGSIIYQIFRIRQVSRRMDSGGNYRIVATAQHKFYDLQRYMIEDSRPTQLQGNAALDWLFTHGWYGGTPSVPDYSYSSDITDSRTAYYQNCNVVAALLGVDQCFINRWGGKLYRDNNRFSINKNMEGYRSSGVIQYSYNMTEIEFEEDDSQLITILIAEDNFGNTKTITNSAVPTETIPHHIYGYVKFSYEEENKALFEADAQAYFNEYKQSSVNITVRFANLSDIEKYKDFLQLDSFEVGDLVTIYHKELDIYYANLEIISKTFDAVSQRTAEIQIGNFKNAITRRSYMAETVSSANTIAEKQYIALDEQLDEVAFAAIVTTPICTSDEKYIVCADGTYILYKA